jgi:hypothetical protein
VGAVRLVHNQGHAIVVADAGQLCMVQQGRQEKQGVRDRRQYLEKRRAGQERGGEGTGVSKSTAGMSAKWAPCASTTLRGMPLSWQMLASSVQVG